MTPELEEGLLFLFEGMTPPTQFKDLIPMDASPAIAKVAWVKQRSQNLSAKENIATTTKDKRCVIFI